MSVEELISNQDLLVDYVWQTLDKDLSDEIGFIANNSMVISDMIDAITYLTVVLNLDKDGMKYKIQSIERKITENLTFL